MSHTDFTTEPLHLENLRILLLHNANPNEIDQVSQQTVWSLMLSQLMKDNNSLIWGLEKKIFSLMLESGADPFIAWQPLLFASLLFPPSVSCQTFYLGLLDDIVSRINVMQESLSSICHGGQLPFPQAAEIHSFLNKLSEMMQTSITRIDLNLIEEVLLRVMSQLDQEAQNSAVWPVIERGFGFRASNRLRLKFKELIALGSGTVSSVREQAQPKRRSGDEDDLLRKGCKKSRV
ncbi:hypothetical protein BT63DRAFT_460201 [Microthyrium microscopicum]|uniref:Uncharacterized protein n=1 Tax=Microthyrium microscopicum TaxID=703497 RepID=A0A6A6U0R9_9PEZI|nr:hypothetical protein BT63DRAFT_460201 [Microthyrium microscopicum]